MSACPLLGGGSRRSGRPVTTFASLGVVDAAVADDRLRVAIDAARAFLSPASRSSACFCGVEERRVALIARDRCSRGIWSRRCAIAVGRRPLDRACCPWSCRAEPAARCPRRAAGSRGMICAWMRARRPTRARIAPAIARPVHAGHSALLRGESHQRAAPLLASIDHVRREHAQLVESVERHRRARSSSRPCRRA